MRSRLCPTLVLLLASASAGAQTVTPNGTTVRAGGQMSVDWTAPVGHSATDWISVYAPGDPDTGYGQYTTPAFTYTGAPLAGTMVFDLYRTTPPGSYEYRYLLNNGYDVAATSGPVTVIDACDGTSFDLQATPPVLLAGEDGELTWTLSGGEPALCPQASDWVALWPDGAPDLTTGYGGTAPTFVYTAAQVTGSATFTVNAGTTPGDYEFRYILQGASASSAASNLVSVL